MDAREALQHASRNEGKWVMENKRKEKRKIMPRSSP
jgi:hypothetical protein